MLYYHILLSCQAKISLKKAKVLQCLIRSVDLVACNKQLTETAVCFCLQKFCMPKFFTAEMELNVRVVPWSHNHEWNTVKECLITGKLDSARKHIQLWKSRTHKLDGGKDIFIELINLNT